MEKNTVSCGGGPPLSPDLPSGETSKQVANRQDRAMHVLIMVGQASERNHDLGREAVCVRSSLVKVPKGVLEFPDDPDAELVHDAERIAQDPRGDRGGVRGIDQPAGQ